MAAARARGHKESRDNQSVNVLNVAYSLAPVAPSTAGGAEQVVQWLDAALVEAGHRSIVLAAAGSKVSGELWTIPSTGERVIDRQLASEIQAAQRHAIGAILRARQIDIIHMHGIDFCYCLPPPGIPVLATLHLPVECYPEEIFHLSRRQTYLNCVSQNQWQSLPTGISALTFIDNGVPIPVVPRLHKKHRFAAALGRICPEKGFHLALTAARKAGMPLILAGQLFRYPAHEAYFKKEILPCLDKERRVIGPVGSVAKRWLLSSAQCLLVPSLVSETSSLVSMEALACGTPVVAFRAGALPGIIDHGRTGFLVNNATEMAAAIAATSELDPKFCRAVARERFSIERMAQAYLSLYRDLMVDSDHQIGGPERSVGSSSAA
ncbi:MAG: glycosyltransferase family 4 protein [Candidatus Binatia bacterium]